VVVDIVGGRRRDLVETDRGLERPPIVDGPTGGDHRRDHLEVLGAETAGDGRMFAVLVVVIEEKLTIDAELA
jgi:hypothetical protein